jgi:hypothetical protein
VFLRDPSFPQQDIKRAWNADALDQMRLSLVSTPLFHPFHMLFNHWFSIWSYREEIREDSKGLETVLAFEMIT